MTWRANKDCCFLVGPTASGKTALALVLAERLGAEIIALDSMTLYRQMDIGTAKPTIAERQQVPHHLLDVLDPWQSASVDWYCRQAGEACAAIVQRGRRPLFVGGTPLYLKALLRGLFEGPPANPALRQQLEAQAAQEGSAVLHQRLRQVDETTAARLHPHDLRRIIRALEVFQQTGTPISVLQTQFDKPADPALAVLCLDWPRPQLAERINRRVTKMFAAGWIEETARLLAADPPPGREASQAVGYAEIAAALRAGTDPGAAIPVIQARTRQFCKRQLTWFRHIAECQFLATHEEEPFATLQARAETFFTTPKK